MVHLAVQWIHILSSTVLFAGWTAPGAVAFIAFLLIVWLMVTKRWPG